MAKRSCLARMGSLRAKRTVGALLGRVTVLTFTSIGGEMEVKVLIETDDLREWCRQVVEDTDRGEKSETILSTERGERA